MRIKAIMRGSRPVGKGIAAGVVTGLALSVLTVTGAGAAVLAVNPQAVGSTAPDVEERVSALIGETGGVGLAAVLGTAAPSLSVNAPAGAQEEAGAAAARDTQQGSAGGRASVEGFATDSGRFTSFFGKRKDPKDTTKSQMHRGVDFAAPIGTPILSPADGVIVVAGEEFRGSKGYGNVVAVESGEILTVFANLDSIAVSLGERVSAGQKIAELGNTGRSTGPHVHIETYVNGELTDPLAVWDWFAAGHERQHGKHADQKQGEKKQ